MTRSLRLRRLLADFDRRNPDVASLTVERSWTAPSLSFSAPAVRRGCDAEPADAGVAASAAARSGAVRLSAAPGTFAAPSSGGAVHAGPGVAPSAPVPANLSRSGSVQSALAYAAPGGSRGPAFSAGRRAAASTAPGPVRPGPGAHLAARRGLRAAATAGRVWRFIGRRATEVRVFLITCAAGFTLLALVDLTRPDVEAPYDLHVDTTPGTAP